MIKDIFNTKNNMRSTTSRKWSEQDDEYIIKNIADGSKVLAERFGVSVPVFRKRCSVLGVSLRPVKEEPVFKKPTKADHSEKFNPKKHKIVNNSTVGKIPFWIPSERMTTYLDPKKATDKHKKEIIKKYANRHRPIV